MSRVDAPPRAANSTDAAPTPAEVARFRTDLDALCGRQGDPLLVAVSGGPDSLALLLLAHAALGERCMAATVDHSLRRESAAEANMVASICAARGVRHVILTAPLPARAGRTANVSARARSLRYRLLAAQAAADGALIATAHHADDQRETVVMRLARGAGVGGLAGIRARSGEVVRPLLGWRRAELAAIVARAGLVAVDDPSNADDRFDRARLRKALASADWLDPQRLVRSTRALAGADEALDWTARRLAVERVRNVGDGTLELVPEGVPAELRRRLVLVCLRTLDPERSVDGPSLDRFVAALEAGRSAMLGSVLASPHVHEGRPVWRFRPAPPRRAR